MNFNAPIPSWVALLMVIVLTALVLYMAFVAHRNGTSADLTIERLATQRDEAYAQRDKLSTERDILSRECRKSEDAIAYYVGELQEAQTERDKWKGLYGELLTTYHALQGDVHATVPLEEAAPVKRTRKKAGAQ